MTLGLTLPTPSICPHSFNCPCCSDAFITRIRYGIYTQFDELNQFDEKHGGMPGHGTSAYGQDYATHFMLLNDDLPSAGRAIRFLSNAATHGGQTLKDTYFIERYQVPFLTPAMAKGVPFVPMAQWGCGELNLVGVEAPTKTARLILGLDDTNLSVTRLLPRLPPGWTQVTAKSWPVLTEAGVVRVDIAATAGATSGGCESGMSMLQSILPVSTKNAFSLLLGDGCAEAYVCHSPSVTLDVQGGAQIPVLEIRIGGTFRSFKNVTHIRTNSLKTDDGSINRVSRRKSDTQHMTETQSRPLPPWPYAAPEGQRGTAGIAWFGANETGFENEEQLSTVFQNYSMVVFGWQALLTAPANYTRELSLLVEQCQIVKKRLTAQGFPSAPVIV